MEVKSIAGGSKIKYFDVSNITFNGEAVENALLIDSLLAKVSSDGNQMIMTSPFAILVQQIPCKILAIGILLDLKVSSEESFSNIITVKENLIFSNLYDTLMSCPEITEEEFYDLTLPALPV